MTTTDAVRAVYLHVPFCHSVCGYCDFYKQLYDKGSVAPVVDALLEELHTCRAAWFRGASGAASAARHPDPKPELRVETLFVGGGTPTSLPADQLGRLLRELAALPRGDAPLEFTIEANPATVDDDVAALLAACGVNRVSMGAQSFDLEELRVLDRRHRPEQVAQTLAACRRAGIVRLNVDLIFAIPGQSLASWERSLEAALALGVDHLSCYGLTYEPGTALHERWRNGAIERVPVELEAEMYELAIDRLADAGLCQYEISNFARPGCECRHNLAYWHNRPYLGLGPSAAGFVGGLRYRNVPDTAAYVQAIQAGRSAWVETEQLSLERRARETIMLELRLNEGVPRREFARRFGHDPVAWFDDATRRHLELGTLAVDGEAMRLTRAGRLLADSVAADFL